MNVREHYAMTSPGPGRTAESLRQYINSRRKLNQDVGSNNPYFDRPGDPRKSDYSQNRDDVPSYKTSQAGREQAKIKYRNRVMNERKIREEGKYSTPTERELKYVRQTNQEYKESKHKSPGKIRSEYVPRSGRRQEDQRKVISNMRNVEYRVHKSREQRYKIKFNSRNVSKNHTARSKKSNKNAFHQSKTNYSYISNMSNYSNISTERLSNNWQSSSRLKNNGHKKVSKKGKRAVRNKSKKQGNRNKDSQISKYKSGRSRTMDTRPGNSKNAFNNYRNDRSANRIATSRNYGNSNLSGISPNSSYLRNNSRLYSHLLSKAPHDSKNVSLRQAIAKNSINNSRSPTNRSLLRKAHENRGKSKKVNKKAGSKKPKKKIQELFQTQYFESVDLDAVIDNWKLLMITRSTLSPFATENYEKSLNSFMYGLFKKRYDSFAYLFSMFNNIREWIYEYMILEFWTMFLLFYYSNREKEKDKEKDSSVNAVSGMETNTSATADSILGGTLKNKFLTIMTRVVGNAFYIGLVLTKASKSKVLPPIGSRIESFQEEARSLEFPTNVPLIKTLKAGNQFIIEKIRELLKQNLPSLKKYFEYSLEISAIGFENNLTDLRLKINKELKNPKPKIFEPIDLNRFYPYQENEAQPKKFRTNLKKQSNVTFTPYNFMMLCLNPKENNSNHNRKIHKKLLKSIKNEEAKNDRPRKNHKKRSKIQKSGTKRNIKGNTPNRRFDVGNSNVSISRSRSGNFKSPANSGRIVSTSRNNRSPVSGRMVPNKIKSTKKKKNTKKKPKNVFKDSNVSGTGISNLLSHISGQYQPHGRMRESSSQGYLSRNNSQISGQYLSRNNSVVLKNGSPRRYASPVRSYRNPSQRNNGSPRTGKKKIVSKSPSKNVFKMSRNDSQVSWKSGVSTKKGNKKNTKKVKKKKTNKIGKKLKPNIFARNTESIESSMNTLANSKNLIASREKQKNKDSISKKHVSQRTNNPQSLKDRVRSKNNSRQVSRREVPQKSTGDHNSSYQRSNNPNYQNNFQPSVRNNNSPRNIDLRAGVNQPSYKYNNSPYSNQTSAQSINRPVSGYSSKYTGVTNYDSYMKNSESNPFNVHSTRKQNKTKTNRSIAPTESYTQVVGLGAETSSPRIRGKGVISGVRTTSTLIENSKAFDVGNKDAKVIRRKRRIISGATRTESINTSKVANGRKTPTDSRILQSRLQEKYRKANAMSHTPEPKRTRPVRHYLKRSRTPEPKPKAPLLYNGIPVPFIKNPMVGREYCLVLDLDETLIHFKTNQGKAKFLIRPYTYNFLKNLSRFYEIIIFTAAQQEYADWILNKIDTKNLISYRFYRKHCVMSRTCHLKDLSKLNRPLSKTLIVDNFQENFYMQKENGIHIRGWYGDTKDKILVNLESLLMNLVSQRPVDIRNFLADAFNRNSYPGLSPYS